MKRNFKVGDRVICIDNAYEEENLAIGGIYTVDESDKESWTGNPLVHLENQKRFTPYGQNRFIKLGHIDRFMLNYSTLNYLILCSIFSEGGLIAYWLMGYSLQGTIWTTVLRSALFGVLGAIFARLLFAVYPYMLLAHRIERK